MLPKLVYALLCSDVIIDRETGSASFIRAFEHGTVPSLPASVPPCCIATLWESDKPLDRPFGIGLSLVDPDGEAHALGTNVVQPTGATLHKVNFRLPGLRVNREGRHRIALAVEREDERALAGELPLYVFVQPREETP